MRINNQEIKNAEISVVSERKVQGLKGLKAISRSWLMFLAGHINRPGHPNFKSCPARKERRVFYLSN